MGREIRRVPSDWQHPKRAMPYGFDYAPLFDKSYEEAIATWETERFKWDSGERPDTECTFEEWHGEKPDPDYYRPAWSDEERTAFQIYETVSEGTPVSPVFATKEEAVEWVVENWGRSWEAAEKFVEAGWAPSFVMSGGHISDANAGAWEPEFLGKEKT